MPNCPRCGSTYETSLERCLRCGYDLASLSLQRNEKQEPENVLTIGDYHVIEELEIDRGFCKSYYVKKEQNRYLLKQKFIPLETSSRSSVLKVFQEETQFFKKLNATGLPIIVDSFNEGDHLNIVLTLSEGVSLLQKIYPEARIISSKELGPLFLPELTLVPLWARQLATILRCIHSQIPYPITHNNLAPDTIYISKDNKVQLLDFGFQRSFKAASKLKDCELMGQKNSFGDPYLSTSKIPNLLSADIFSYGRVLDFLLTGVIPSSPDDPVIITQVSDNFAISDPRNYLSTIIDRCCSIDISNRYTNVDELLEAINNLSGRTSTIEGENILCEACGYSNRISAHFCSRCGNLLTHLRKDLSSSTISIQLSYDDDAQEMIIKSFYENRISPLKKFELHEALDKAQADPGLDVLICADSLTKVQKMPHQQEAALKVLRQMRGRALLADEVGLGKTIEAGIILKELLLRKLADSILILCPSQLCAQWQLELFEKFDEMFLVMGINIDTSLAWRCDRIIAPYSTVEQRFHADELLQHSYDLVILDEAHYLNEPTNWKVLQTIQNLRKKYFLLLSATPMHNEIRELYNIITLLRPGHFEDWNNFSSRFLIEKRQIRLSDLKNKELINHLLQSNIIEEVEKQSEDDQDDGNADYRIGEFTDAYVDEKTLSQALEKANVNGTFGASIIEIWRRAERRQIGVKNAPELRKILLEVMIRNIRKEVAKDYPFPVRTATRYELELAQEAKNFYDRFRRFYQKGLRKVRNRYFQYQMGEIVERLSSSPDAFSYGVRHRLKTKIKRQLGETFVNELDRYAANCPRTLVEPKLLKAFERAQHFVNQGDKVLIFSQFNETTRYAFGELKSSKDYPELSKVSLLYDEGDEEVVKFQTLRKFISTSGPALLFCPAEISEGVNLQRARVMINLDLPWDPMKIEQRIGRIQRLGGHSEVVIINLVLKNTIEEDILRILEQKIQMFEAVVGKVEEIIGNLSQADDFRAMICDLYMENRIETEDGQVLNAQQRIDQAIQNAVEHSSNQESENLLNKVLRQETNKSIFFTTDEKQEDDW
jgi:SNF2 family DNA or RNA helicase